MARNKLIAKYSALNTENLPQRIYDKIQSYIEIEGIEQLPYLELSGRWTGKLDISSGGWRGDFDLVCPVLTMCRVDRHGVVSPDMSKIIDCVEDWVDYLTTPDEDDEYIGVSDETFRDSDYISDDANDFRSAAYAAEIDSFMNSEVPDIAAHDKALSEIDAICRMEKDAIEDVIGDERLFEEGFSAIRINSGEEFQKLIESMDREAAEGGGVSWTSPDIDMEEIKKIIEEQNNAGQSWMEFIDNLRNGRFGYLPEDYDGLGNDDDLLYDD